MAIQFQPISFGKHYACKQCQTHVCYFKDWISMDLTEGSETIAIFDKVVNVDFVDVGNHRLMRCATCGSDLGSIGQKFNLDLDNVDSFLFRKMVLNFYQCKCGSHLAMANHRVDEHEHERGTATEEGTFTQVVNVTDIPPSEPGDNSVAVQCMGCENILGYRMGNRVRITLSKLFKMEGQQLLYGNSLRAVPAYKLK